MNNFCSKCGQCCKLIPVLNGSLIRNGIQPMPDFLVPVQIINDSYAEKVQKRFPEVKFFRCKYITENNICTNPDKPEFCKDFPSSPLALIPGDCYYTGEIFLKKEKLKQKIRRLKEEIIHYEALILSDEKDKHSYLRIIDAHKRFIKKYELFGSELW